MLGICLFLSIQAAHSQFNATTELKPGLHYLYGNQVRMRLAPTLKASIIFTLPIATKIDVIEKTTSQSTIENEMDYWYKVKYNGQEGYIWGSLIADHYFEGYIDTDTTKDLLLILNLTMDSNLGHKENNVWKCKMVKDHEVITELEEKVGNGIAVSEISIKNWVGFGTPLRLLDISYDFNGEVGGSAEAFLRYEKSQLELVFDFTNEYGEGGYACYSSMTLPNDEKGEANKILINEKCAEVSECNDTKENPCNWTYTHSSWTWDGKKFIHLK